MKKTLLFTKKTNRLFTLLVLCLCVNLGFSQTNLVKNGTCDDHGTGSDSSNTDDNADAWDMTPNSTLNGGIVSPYRYDADDNPTGWRNDDLADWLETNCGDSDEQPGSTSDGNYDYSAGPTAGVKTRGVKIGEACRRLYQKVAVTPGTTYTFAMESRSEAQTASGGNVNSEVFILNTEISDEVGLSSSSSTVDAYFNITNDFSSSKSSSTTDNFTKSTFNFTASGSFVVIYVRATLAVDDSHEVFYDNISLVESSTASLEDNELSRSFNVYPNPASGRLFIKSNEFDVSNVRLFNVMGQKILDQDKLSKDQLDISGVSKGIYILKVTSDSRSFSQKVIIE